MDIPILEIKHLSHRYNIQWAVRDINVEIKQKGIYGLLGSNGAGKSTLMNTICGIIKQTEGEILIYGKDTLSESLNAKLSIGFLPQNPPLYDDLTIEEYLELCCHLHYLPASQIPRAINEVLERCSISHFRKRLIKNLSGGYKQRVGIAQAIIHHPRIVILDEPTNGLDPNQILEVRHLIKQIAETSTVILSTHVLQEVQAICDHIVMIEEGKVVFNDTMEQFNNYLRPFSLSVTFMDPPTEEELAAIPGVTQVEGITYNEFRIFYSDEAAATDGLLRRCAQYDWTPTEIRVERSSLELIFKALSQKNK